MKKVEKFRLTKDQVGWMKEVQKVNKIENLLTKGALQQWLLQGKALQRAFGELAAKKQMLEGIAPKEKVDEIPEQTAEEMREGSELLGEQNESRVGSLNEQNLGMEQGQGMAR